MIMFIEAGLLYYWMRSPSQHFGFSWLLNGTRLAILIWSRSEFVFHFMEMIVDSNLFASHLCVKLVLLGHLCIDGICSWKWPWTEKFSLISIYLGWRRNFMLLVTSTVASLCFMRIYIRRLIELEISKFLFWECLWAAHVVCSQSIWWHVLCMCGWYKY